MVNQDRGLWLVSPTERPATPLSLPNVVSSIPEDNGCDFLHLPSWIGVQRKTPRDLAASLSDGRLSKEINQAISSQFLNTFIVAIDGTFIFSDQGADLDSGLTSVQIEGLKLSLAVKSIATIHYADLNHLLLSIVTHHLRTSTLLSRKKPENAWGNSDNKSFVITLLQTIPGIGLQSAQKIYEKHQNPFLFSLSESELAKIVGKSKASKIIKAIPSHSMTATR